ncbi:MAG: LCP family protein [Ornithinibacter sp.]
MSDDATRRDRADSASATKRHSRRRRIVAVVAVAALAIVSGAGVLWWRLEGNISRLDVSGMLGDRPDRVSDGPLNILLIGSDSRDDQGVPGASLTAGARSDTTLIAHVSADREHVTVVSVPRDSMVEAPPRCSASIPRDQWTVQQWNSMYGIGGPGCLINTIEGNTGLFIDHFAVVDFNGFRDMVDALGGVPVCTNDGIDDPKAKITLTPGRHVLDGTQALGYVRARYTIGDGSDLGRIERQQAFLSSVVQEATRTSLLLRPDKLFGFLNAATQSLTTDPDFGTGTMGDLASSVKNIGIGNVQFVTVPVEDYPEDPNRVQWAASADDLWAALREDTVLGAEPEASASPAPLTMSPADIGVEVVNATGVTGLAAQAAEALTVQGFEQVTTASTPERPTGVVVEYGTGNDEAARTVAAAFEGAKVRENEGLGDVVRVTLGAGAPDVAPIPNRLGTDPVPTPTISAPTPQPTASIETRTADQDICS